MKRILSLTAILMLAAMGAHAGQIIIPILTLTLDQPFVYANPGDVVTFDGILSAPYDESENYDTVYLNGYSVNIDYPLTLDASPFFDNEDLWYMYPPQTTTDVLLFLVTVPPGTPAALYGGNFEIDGNVDGSSNNYPLANANFDVQVNQSTPEPSSLALLAAGALLALGKRFSALFRRPLSRSA